MIKEDFPSYPCSIKSNEHKKKSGVLSLRIWPYSYMHCAYLVAKLCPTLCDRMDCSPPSPQSMGFPRQKYRTRLPFPSPGDLPIQELNPYLLHWQTDFLPLSHIGSPNYIHYFCSYFCWPETTHLHSCLTIRKIKII